MSPKHKNEALTLYIVRFLHQTTTAGHQGPCNRWLYIVRFLHQTTTVFSTDEALVGCISSVSYIKPQLTSGLSAIFDSCISSVSYIKPQLRGSHDTQFISCISSVSYIKPQRVGQPLVDSRVVYRPFPTSNHNFTTQQAELE